MMKAPGKHPGWTSEAALQEGTARLGTQGTLVDGVGGGSTQVGLVPTHGQDSPALSSSDSPFKVSVSERSMVTFRG